MSDRMGKMRGAAIRRHERGFTLVELLIVIVMLAISTGWALVRLSQARASFRLASSVTELAGDLERARVDSIRRRAEGSGRASVSVLNTTTYQVKVDTNANGELGTRDVKLPDGVNFPSTMAFPATITFDWRGRPTSDGHYALQNTSSETTWVQVTAAGDITVQGDDTVPTVNPSNAAASTLLPHSYVVPGS